MGALQDRNVVIIGGLGFIGSNLALRCAQLGANVHVVDALIDGMGGDRSNLHPGGESLTVTIADARDLLRMRPIIEGADTVFYVAGQTSHEESMRDPLGDLDLNCRGLLTILEAWRLAGQSARLLFTGTRQIYGRPEHLPVRENHRVSPADVNGVSNLACENYLDLYGKTYGLESTAFRLTNTYGPRMPLRGTVQGFIGTFLKRALEGEVIEIYGSGDQLRDYCYVDDVVEALILAAASEFPLQNRVYNVGSVDRCSINEFVLLLNELLPVKYVHLPFPDDLWRIDIGSYYADYSLLVEDSGWVPRVGLREGLRRTLEFESRHRI